MTHDLASQVSRFFLIKEMRIIDVPTLLNVSAAGSTKRVAVYEPGSMGYEPSQASSQQRVLTYFFSFHSHADAGRLPGLLQNQNRQSRVQQRKPTKSFQGN